MFEFTEEYEPLLKEVREIAGKVVKPRAKEIEESDEFPLDTVNKLFNEWLSEKWKSGEDNEGCQDHSDLRRNQSGSAVRRR
jgi:alkylation response protein AidB-like acyl-CoA dehydrogenase